MKAFMSAAFPWLLAGLALVMIAAAYAGARDEEAKKAYGQKIVTGAGLGIVAGAVLNICGFLNSNVICLTIVPLLGMAIASMIPERGSDACKKR